MFNWRNAIFLAVIFVVVAALYWVGFYVLSSTEQDWDYTGMVLLGALGVAMAFGFMVLLKSSREL